MIAPITHHYPPTGYGPWERAVHDLTERLVAEGLDVTLFAAEGSVTKANLVPTVAAPLVESDHDPRLIEEAHLSSAMEFAREGSIDLLHSHLHVHALVFSRLIPCRLLTTLHGAAWDRSHHPLLRRYSEMPFVALSSQERSFLPELNYVRTIPHGLDLDEFRPGNGGGGYLAFVGRMAPEKAPDLAIDIARRSGFPLLMAGPLDGAHREFFDQVMKQVRPGVDYLGPLSREDIGILLADAEALLMPLRWHEPFGLVVIEALAAATPVIAWRMGAMPEIIEEGVTGFLVDNVPEACAAVSRLEELSRARCRTEAEVRFSDRRMASDYSQVYRSLIRSSRTAARKSTAMRT